MVPTRKRIFIIICIVVILGCLLRILLFNSPLPPVTDQTNYQRAIGAPVLVMVFYEALCPDSKYFITKQLLTAYEVAAPIMEVVSCMIRDNRLPQEAMRKCVKQYSENIDLVQKCYDSDHGLELMKHNGEATHSLRPQVTFIPTITIDGSQGRQASILKNLLSEVCKAAGDTDQAKKICKNTV
ncbi:gamma-interferon-inducible lysosomal thiol reductase [Drosophila madeirensis]|uniref:Gamma-interferon-inducible lysosomal thiol reductase n=1 Tax=Drosophila madeirensis TaxID=30013 RepID=A0AAU9FE54_DROMD